jgi:ribonucleoside-diphosphate reductase alpha chain
VFVVEDSIEGWSDAIGVLLSSYLETDVPFPKYQGCYVSFDYSDIRPKGALISGGFKAPGHEGLRNSINKIEELLEKELDKPNFDGVIESIIAYDIVMHISDAVLSGGVRRSATICLFSPDDEKMLKAKTGKWHLENPQRARSNNTVCLNRNTIEREDFHKFFESVKEFGEPGFGFVENEDIAYNPCFEIGMKPQTETGISGWQGCNLCEINGGKCDTEEIFYDACKAAAIIGTMQATYTDFKYVGAETKEIFDREALIGCSITGLMNNPEILLNAEIQRKGARIVKEINKEVAKMLGINQAARTTCVKPSGNASVLLSTASGIHGEHAPRYIRNVQANKEDDVAKYFKELNPKMVEDSVWSANGTDWVISFPISPNANSIFKDELYGVKLLEYVKFTQQNWVEEGTNVDLCTDHKLRHNVSNTIQVDNWDDVEKYIFDNRQFFAGISLLSMSGDKDYNQAPFTAVFTPQELVAKYGDAAMFASGLIVDGLNAFNNNLWLACDTVMGLGEKLEYTETEVKNKLKTLTPRESWEKLGFKNGTLEILSKNMIKPEIEEFKRLMDSKLIGSVHNYAMKKDWIRRANQFASRYFSNNKEMTYCLKDAHNYHKWVEINRDIIDIDWNSVSIKPKFTDIDTTGAVSCSGGACEVV